MSNPWKSPFETRFLRRHDDARGFLFEVIRFKEFDIPSEGQVYTFSIAPGQRRGDHYHEKKQEWWTCVHGAVTVLLSSPAGETAAVELSAANPSLVYMAPQTSHAALNSNSDTAVIVAYTSTAFNPAEPDTYMKPAYEGFKR